MYLGFLFLIAPYGVLFFWVYLGSCNRVFLFFFVQGQMLTVVEYFLLLYRALLPAPVWYRFFLNKEYGSLFSSLTTGLYLTFKLTSVVEKVIYLPLYNFSSDTEWMPSNTQLFARQIQSFFTSLRALSHK